MARIPERKFDPARKVVARKYFIANGRRYEPGVELDWRTLMIPQRRVQQMFDAGKLDHKTEAQEAALEALADAGQYWDVDEKAFEDQHILAVAAGDDLDAIDDMKELRRIADEIGAPYKVSKADQREAIRVHRKEIEE